MASYRRQFLQELIKQHDPAISNTDVQDVALAAKISLAEGESLAKQLEEEGYLQTVGLGGNIAPTARGRQAAGDASWD
jgi:hypothetical protein